MVPQAVGDNVICREIPESNMTEGGIIMPEGSAPTRPQKNCEVMSVGELVEANILPGDEVVVHTQAGQAMFLDKQVYIVLKAPEIYGVVNRDLSQGKQEVLMEQP